PRAADAPDLPFEGDAGRLEDAAPDLLAEAFEVGGRRAAGVDEEIGVLLGDLRAAAREAAAAGAVDQLPRLVARRIGEGRAAGAGADRLAGFARRVDLVHAPADRRRIAGLAGELGGDEDPIRRGGAVAVGEAERGGGDLVAPAFAVERDDAAQHVGDLAPIGAGIHPQRAAERAGDAGEKFEPGDAGLAAGE